MITSFEELIQKAVDKESQRVAVAVAEDPEVLAAVKDAKALGIADFTLVGDKKKIVNISEEVGLDLGGIEVVDAVNPVEACRTAVQLVSSGQAQLVMKGLVGTAVILRAVLDKEIGLRTGNLLSHVAILEAVGYDRLILMTDGGMNIAPDLQQKAQIVQNAVEVACSLGFENPKVAPIAALELVNPDMPATVDAALLAKMAERGQIRNCIIDGPLALDNAISKEAAKHKGIVSAVAGDADILLVPYIEVGNVLYKSMVYFAGAQAAGVIAGARAPIVLTSRADSHQTKVNSIAAAVLMA